MTGTDYNVALAIFFVPYVLCEVPSNMLLAKFERPSVYIGILIFLWGIVMTLSGVVQNFGGLVATRFFLGLFEYASTNMTLHSKRLTLYSELDFSPELFIWLVNGILRTALSSGCLSSTAPAPPLAPSPASLLQPLQRWTA